MNALNEIIVGIAVALICIGVSAIKRYYDLRRIGRKVCICPVCGCLHRSNCCDPPDTTPPKGK